MYMKLTATDTEAAVLENCHVERHITH